MERLILIRHAHSASNADAVVSGAPPGDGLSPQGIEQAVALRDVLAGEPIDVGLTTEFRRARETLELALASRSLSLETHAGLNEIAFGSFEGGLLSRYREWAWNSGPAAPCPGSGESRADVAARLAEALDALLERPEAVVAAVSHALPVRYVVDAAAGLQPRRRLQPVAHAAPFGLDAAGVGVAATTLRAWSEQPRFRDDSIEG